MTIFCEGVAKTLNLCIFHHGVILHMKSYFREGSMDRRENDYFS